MFANTIYSEQNKPYFFTLRSVLFAFLLIVEALGSTSYAMTLQLSFFFFEQNEILAANSLRRRL